jgi:hypothetical protein
MKDELHPVDRLELRHDGEFRYVNDPDWVEELLPKDKIHVEGFFSVVCRERGKIVPGSRRQGKNIVTLAGREFYARVGSYSSYSPLTKARNDGIRYIGFGIGTTPEVSSVTHLVNPISYSLSSGGLFLADLAIPTYPFQTSASFGTAVRYTREFAETELSTSGTIDLTEAGLFTDGSPTSTPAPFTPGTRNLTLSQALLQAPNAYKSFEVLKKTQNFVLQVAWEIRF